MYEQGAIRDLGIVAQLRGVHSTGLFNVYEKDGSIGSRFHKMAESASYVLHSRVGNEIIFGDDPVAIAIHCRHATVGNIDDESAHPYKVGHIIGMHNGTCDSLSHNKIGDRKITDSESLFNILAGGGIQEAAYAANAGTGAYALVWLDMKKGTLNFARNEKRTLCFMAGAAGTQYWASEAEMLNLIKARSGSTSWGTPITMYPHKHVFIDLTSMKWYHEALRISRPYIPVVKQEPVVAPPKPKEVAKDSNSTVFRYRAFRGKTMKFNKAIKLLNKGCANNADHVCKSSDKTYWFNNSNYLCAECAKDPFIREAVKAQRLYPSELVRIPK